MQYAEITRVGPLAPPRPRFVPWHVPAWLPVEAEGLATFLVGVIGGLFLAFALTTLARLIAALTS
jgi:hypothetical protein